MFTDEIVLNVVRIDIWNSIGYPISIWKKFISYHEENKYHIFKDKVEYIVRAHSMKNKFSLVSVEKLSDLWMLVIILFLWLLNPKRNMYEVMI